MGIPAKAITAEDPPSPTAYKPFEALPVSNTIAEDFERGTTNELLAFLYLARESADAVGLMLGYVQHRTGRSQISGFRF